MEREQLEKNSLDLSFHRKLQEQNALLILATTGALTFLGTFIWNPARFRVGLILTFVIWSACAIWYLHSDRDLKRILENIKRIKS